MALAAVSVRPLPPPAWSGEGLQVSRLHRDGRPIRVVIAEDEAMIVLDLQNIIKEAGGEVAGVAVRGQDAITLAAALRPDVVLMDVHLMGDLDGIQAARAIRALRGVSVVFVTAHSDADTWRRMFEVVPTSPVIKPISEAHLREAIIRACR
jgi:DNA-binding NarL/FixJ family response regulator